VTDYAAQRENMVESQVRPSDITDRRIIRAMQALPREEFVPEWARATAYVDRDIPVSVANGRILARSMPAPRTLAKLVQLAEIEENDRVLVVGCSTGYGVALVARLAAHVTGLEEDSALAGLAEATLHRLGVTNSKIVRGLLTGGVSAAGPFDVIIFEGSLAEIPATYIEQLKDGGRAAAIIAPRGDFGVATLFRKRGGSTGGRPAFDAGAKRLPGFDKTPGFSF
jgi:protein-L-isoaspartate(D-aspartate) O-methyltransferase